jgi:hypothetical protein
MVSLAMKKLMITVLAALILLLMPNVAAEGLQAAGAKRQQAGPKRHKLPATLETTHWAWLDSRNLSVVVP